MHDLSPTVDRLVEQYSRQQITRRAFFRRAA